MLFLCENRKSDQVTILPMPRQHSCRDMCKFVTDYISVIIIRAKMIFKRFQFDIINYLWNGHWVTSPRVFVGRVPAFLGHPEIRQLPVWISQPWSYGPIAHCDCNPSLCEIMIKSAWRANVHFNRENRQYISGATEKGHLVRYNEDKCHSKIIHINQRHRDMDVIGACIPLWLSPSITYFQNYLSSGK